MIKYSLILTFIITVVLCAQLGTEIKSHFSSIKQGKSDNNTRFLNDSIHYSSTLKEIQAYYSDSLVAVRKEAYYLTRVIGEKTHDAKLRRQVTESLSLACLDKDAAIAVEACNGLTKFRLQDFNETAKANIRKKIAVPDYSFSQLVRIAGFLNLSDQKDVINGFLSNAKLKGQEQWSARLALARMGDKEQIKFCLDKLKNVQLSSRSLETVIPDLVYIRQKETLDYVFEIINSDTKNCSSSNPDNPVSIPCAYRALKHLAFAVKSYPINPDRYGDVEIVDYEKALKQVREWYKMNKNKIEIVKDNY